MSELAVGSLKGLAANSFVIDVASGSKIVQPGAVLQVVSVAKTDTFTTASTSFTPITGFSASITPISTSSKILVLVSITVSGDVNGALNLRRNSTDIAQPTTSATVQSTIYSRSAALEAPSNSFVFLDNPSSSSAVTYDMTIVTNAGTIVVNRRAGDTNNSTVSTITLMEIAG